MIVFWLVFARVVTWSFLAGDPDLMAKNGALIASQTGAVNPSDSASGKQIAAPKPAQPFPFSRSVAVLPAVAAASDECHVIIAGQNWIQRFDPSTQTLSFVAGELAVAPPALGGPSQFADGVGSKARFRSINSLLCSSDGRRVYCCDGQNHRVRCITLSPSSGDAEAFVSTVAGNGQIVAPSGVSGSPPLKGSLLHPRYMAFDNYYHSTAFAAAGGGGGGGDTKHVSPFHDSVMYITGTDTIYRLQLPIAASELWTNWLVPSGVTDSITSPIPVIELWRIICEYSAYGGWLQPILPQNQQILPGGVAVTPSGRLVVSRSDPPSISSIDPVTGHTERLCGTGLFDRVDGPALRASIGSTGPLVIVKQTAYIGDFQIRKLTLPPKLFIPPANPHTFFN